LRPSPPYFPSSSLLCTSHFPTVSGRNIQVQSLRTLQHRPEGNVSSPLSEQNIERRSDPGSTLGAPTVDQATGEADGGRERGELLVTSTTGRGGKLDTTCDHSCPRCGACVHAHRDLIVCCTRRSVGWLDTTSLLTTKGRLTGWVGFSGVKVSGRGWRVSPLLSPFAVRMEMPRVCPDGRVGGQADQPGSTRTLSPSVHGGDAGHVGTDIWARPSNCAETLKASGTALGWRHPTSTMW
jgi:hypothetical protein